MKKTVLTLLSLILLPLLFILPAGALAADLSEVTATLDDGKWVTVSGYISSGSGQAVSVKITDPEGDIEYIGSTVSDKWSCFRFYYFMENTAAGRYAVTVNAFGISEPAATYFEYGMNNQLKALTVSKGSLSPAFSPEMTEYTVTVGAFTESITLTPTAADSEAVIKVNGAVVTSGSSSAALSLSEGSNTIEAAVTAQNGDTRTYIITVVREVITDTTLTANASIDKEKNVTVSGRVSSGTGRLVPVRITAPDGGIEYIGAVTSSGDNSYRLSYNMSNETPGRYTVHAGAMGVAEPAEAYFDYGSNAALKNLVLSQGRPNPDFNPETMTYTVRYEGASLTVTPTADDEKAKIEVNGSEVISGSPSAPIDIIPGENTITVKVTARDGKNTKEYVLTVSKTEAFVLSVTAEIDGSKQVIISGSGAEAGKKVAVMVTDPEGNVDYLDTSETTAEGDFQFSYTLTNELKGIYQVFVGAKGLLLPLSAYFLYDANSPELSRLELSDGSLSPEFAGDETEYSADVDYKTSSVKVRPYAVDPLATIKVNGSTVKSGENSGAINLKEGRNTIRVVVTTPDGQEKTYTIDVTRDYAPPKSPSGNANLSGLTVSAGSLDPAFSADRISYTVNVGNNVSEITVTPTTADAKATVTVNGAAVTGGQASQAVALGTGNNTITVTVTAEAGNTQNYIITVKRAYNVNLSSMNLSRGDHSGIPLTPTFEGDTDKSYTASVANIVSDVRVTPSAIEPKAVIRVNGTVVNSGNSQMIDLNVGENTITVTVTAPDETSKTYMITVTRAASNNAYLSGLTVSPGSLDYPFNPDRPSYNVNVANSVFEITVTPTTADAAATVTVHGKAVNSGSASDAVPISVGINTVLVEVTAENGAKYTYTLVVIRKESSNANLSGITVNAGTLSPVFEAGTTSYTVSVDNSVTSIKVGIVTADEWATIVVNGLYGYDNNIPFTAYLDVGNNVIQVDVKAQDGVTVKRYTITVTREASVNAYLSGISLSSGSITDFAQTKMSYTVNVPNSVSTIRVTPFAADPFATIKVNGTNVSSGGTTNPISLSAGDNTISIVVTAQNGIGTNTYTITVKRAYNVNLSALQLKSGSAPGGIILTPTFAGDTLSYTASVHNDVSSVTVTPHKAAAEAATIMVNGTEVARGSDSKPIGLNVGPNTITVTVTAPDNTSNTYTITVTRAPLYSAELSVLTVDEGSLEPVFNPPDINYTVKVPSHTESVTVRLTTLDPNAMVAVKHKGMDVAGSGGVYTTVEKLDFGPNNWIRVTVTAQDGKTKTYNITVDRLYSYDATLKALEVSSGVLSPTFDPSVTNYTVDVVNSVDSITVTPTVNDTLASVTVSPSQPISLVAGESKMITIRVTPQLGAYNYYYVTVTRALSDNANLSALAVSAGSLEPEFSAGTTSYEVSVDYGTTKLKVTPTVADSTATVKVNGQPVTSGSESGDIDLRIGENTIDVAVTAQNGTVKTYVLTVTSIASENADLSGITLSTGSLNEAFDKDVTEYTMNVANAVTGLTVTPTVADSTATVTVNGGASPKTIELAVGETIVNIIITAQDEKTVKKYKITVTRAESSNADLSGLKVGSESISLSEGTTSYSVDVANGTDTVTVTPTAADSAAKKIEVNGTVVASGSPSGSISLIVGNNTITVTVTAEDGTVKEYEITVTRAKSSNANLSSLKVGSESISLSEGTTSYSVDVANGTDTVTVTPTAADPAAKKIEVNGTVVASGSPSGSISLIVGNNTITVTVTAQDDTVKEYTITVNRAESDNANLSGLLLMYGGTELTLNYEGGSGFDFDIFAYTLDVENEVDSITVTPTVADPTASVIVKRNGTGTGVSGSGGVYTVSLAVYGNTIEVEVTAENETKKTYTVTVDRAPSDNADLASLSVTGWEMSPAFDKGTKTYTLTVGSSTDRIVVHTEAVESNAAIEIKIDERVWSAQGEAGASIDLTGQDTAEITITVIAQDGEHSETYTIEVGRSSAYSDASLSDLKFEFYNYDEFNDQYFYRGMGYLIPTDPEEGNGFTPEYYEYECWNMEGYLTVTSTAASVYAKSIKVTFLGAEDTEISSEEVASGSATEHISMEGLITVEVEVTAYDDTKAVYTVTRAGSDNADLSWITLSAGDLNEEFSEGRTDYTADVPHEVSSITVKPVTDAPLATVTVNGTAVDRGYDSQEISLNVGSDNEICIEVTALDGVTVKTYTITVTRAESGDAGLSGMMFSTDSLNETSAGDVTGTEESEEIQPSLYTVGADGRLTGGTIHADAATAALGTIVTLTVTPEEGWQLKDGTLKYFDGTEDHAITGESFTMPAADVTVTAEFEEIPADDADLSDDQQLENDSQEADPEINQ